MQAREGTSTDRKQPDRFARVPAMMRIIDLFIFFFSHGADDTMATTVLHYAAPF